MSATGYKKINFTADRLICALLDVSRERKICLLDSCAVNHLGSHLLIAGIAPIETFEIFDRAPQETLKLLDEKLACDRLFSFFTISYEFGLKLENIHARVKEISSLSAEPDVFLAVFDCVIFHDYKRNETFLIGNRKKFAEIECFLDSASASSDSFDNYLSGETIRAESNFTRGEYLAAVEKIKEHIRRGDTYQTNLTQQIRASLPEDLSPQQIFYNLRKNHPAPFAAFLQRADSTVVSASPERFFKMENGKTETQNSKFQNQNFLISASPIKGTRRRGKNPSEDSLLREELLHSVKDRAENVMIVDLLRNDLGKVCEFGTVAVEKLCALETHPTLFHLVSTIKGELRQNIAFSDVIKAVFPCGSITGAPKIRTMQIIDEIETSARGLSMGAIGCSIPDFKFQISDSSLKSPNPKFLRSPLAAHRSLDLSVAIRTMVFSEKKAVFNVGGGIVIDSDAVSEYEESLLKAKALLDALGAKF